MTANKNNKKYKILISIRWFGGIRTFIRYVYNNFDHSLYHLTILAPESPGLKILQKELKNLAVVYIPFENHSSNLKLFKTVAEAIVRGKFDLVHSQGFTAGICSVLPACLSKTPHIMTSHDVFRANQFEGLKGHIRKKILSLSLPLIDIIHSVSQDAQNNLLEFIPRLKKHRKKLLVIPNGIETECFKGQKKRNLHKELNLADNTFLIGFLGRFMSQKGFIYLVEALELLIKTSGLPKRPVVVAFGEGGFIREDRAKIKQKGLEEYFHFLPFIPNVASTIRGLDVVAMPSLWEACGLLALEAMVAGVPVIGTDCIGLREVMQDTPCVMVPAGNSEILAKVLTNEIKNPSQAKAEAFRNEAAKRFDVRKQAKELENILLGLL